MGMLVTLRFQGDAAKIEAEDEKLLTDVTTRAKEHGLISHRFWGSGNEILVVDEWPDQASFQKFFEASPEIPGIMQRAGVTAEPEIKFWRKLDTGDDVG